MSEKNKLQILCENIRILSERGQNAARQRQICVRELARLLAANGEERPPEELYRAFRAALPEATPEDRVGFCALLSCSPTHGPRLARSCGLTAYEPAAPGSHGRIAMVRNPYNEQAFSRFSTVVTNAKPAYLSSFSEACEDVFDSRCEFCILPMENTEGGRMVGFYSMMDRYDLRICACCRLDTEEQSDSVRYALVGKARPDRLPRQSDYYLEFSVTAQTGQFPEDMLRAVAVLDATLLGLDSLPVPYSDGLQRYSFTLRVTEQSAYALDLYLSAEHTGYAPIGLYPMLP